MIVGYFNFSEEGDPFSQVGFGLFLNANLAQTFILSSSPAIYRWCSLMKFIRPSGKADIMPKVR